MHHWHRGMDAPGLGTGKMRAKSKWTKMCNKRNWETNCNKSNWEKMCNKTNWGKCVLKATGQKCVIKGTGKNVCKKLWGTDSTCPVKVYHRCVFCRHAIKPSAVSVDPCSLWRPTPAATAVAATAAAASESAIADFDVHKANPRRVSARSTAHDRGASASAAHA